ncbi:MAG: hypothetical protein IPM61_04135 [Chlorobi bacterium]|nr:hypothetical protein [Chlorobiota bacterium]MBX7216935.1 hypothetical protein [Candidatus Kapabacteria bacterium]
MSTELQEPSIARQESNEAFDALQQKLIPLWKSIQSLNHDEQTIVIIPSFAVDLPLKGSELQAYEERFLFLLFLLRQPRARVIYATSQAIHPSVIDYYVSLLPGVIASHARRRLFLVSPLDASTTPLTKKLLARPRLLAQIKELIPDSERAHLVPFSTTDDEKELALQLGIPMYGADPKFFPLGTKSGCRKIFEEEGVAHPIGEEDLWSIDDLIAAIARMRAKKPRLEQVIVKQNDGVSGFGNALVDLRQLPPAGSDAELAAIAERLHSMQFDSPAVQYARYISGFQAQGGIVEERIVGQQFRSPSVQMRVTPLGKVELLSTHDQLLGGPEGQSYLGCKFPANPEYALLISQEAMKVGERLQREGVLGRFAIDFVVVRSEGEAWQPYAIELNLRKGGTTHPFLTLQFLTDGTYDPMTAEFTAPSGRKKFFVASDHIESEKYRVFTPDDLFDIIVRRGLHFDQSRQTGIVCHMMTSLAECGRMGFTAVANSMEEAEALYHRAIEILDQEANG